MDFSVTTIIITVITIIFTFAVSIAMLFQFIRYFKYIRIYAWFGLSTATIITAILIIMFVMIFPHMKSGVGFFEFIGFFINFTKITGFTMLGMYYCWRLMIPSFPLFEKLLKFNKTPGEWNQNSVLFNPSILKVTYYTVFNNIKYLHVTHDRKDINFKLMLGVIALIVTSSVAYTEILFELTSPSISEHYFDFSDLLLDNYEPSFLYILLYGIISAFAEEVLFRLGMQNFLANNFNLRNNKYYIAILITTIVWTLSHWGSVDPGWVKMLQVFPVGIALGWMFKRYGIESCIITHILFNTISIILFHFDLITNGNIIN